MSTTPMATTPILEVKGVSRYFGKFRALNKVSVGKASLSEGQKVSFEITAGNKGKKQASNIQAA